MAYKDILVYADVSKVAPARLDMAARLAATYGAHLVALHVVTPPFIPVDMGMGVSPDLIAAQEEFQAQYAVATKKVVEEARRRTGQEIEYRQVRGDMAGTAALHARYADLAVVSQRGADISEPMDSDLLPEAIVMGSGRPTLILPRHGKFAKLGERVLVAWSRTRESTRAVHDALPILTRAKSVTIMEVNPDRDAQHIAGADIAHHLARHGVKADVASITAAGEIGVGDAILSRMADIGTDLLVMGAYGHSRVREIALGGVTRHILNHMTVPVLMSH